MKRKICDELVEWTRRDNGSSALLIDGARRVGKSWVAEEFAKAEYKSYILIDFLLAKAKLMRRHNIVALEVKSGRKYGHTWADLCCASVRLCA